MLPSPSFSVDRNHVLRGGAALTDAVLLPGFELVIAELFAVD